MIHHFKYGKVETLGQPLGQLLLRAVPENLSVDLIVPVPLHWARRIWRGFNQCEVLARPLSMRWAIPIVRALRRKRFTKTQTRLTSSQRRLNLNGAFVLSRPDIVKGKRVLLLDDVLTTGATVTTCSALLRQGGALSVTVLTLARVDRRPMLGNAVLTAASAAGGGAK